jgi:CheY-like chemotaxis protein
VARLILLADDSPTIQRRAQTILEGEGFEVETVSNGVAAIKKLPKMQPVLVLADVSMPGKDGYEVCDYVKTSPDLHHVPVLLVASDLEPYDELRGAQVGADGIIKKPFAAHDLIAMVARFAAHGEAPASSSALPETLVTSSPVTPPEVSPMGYEPEGATGRHEPDFSAPSAGVAFAQPPEMPATPPEPLPDISLQPSLQPPLPVWPRPLPEPLLAAPLEDVLGGSSEPLLVPTEPFPGLALEGTPEPTPVAPEPTPEPIPEAAPESVLVSSESISATALEATSEPALVVSALPIAESGVPCAPGPVTETVHLPAEAAPEVPPAVPAEEPLLPAEPAVAEQQVEPLPPLRPSPELVEPAADRTLALGVAAEIAGPMLIDELAPAPPAPEPPPFVEGQQPKPMAATSLDSFSLAEVATGQVYIAPPEAEAAPSPEAGVVQPGEAPEHPPSVINPEWVNVIVHKVVMKMAPPVLPRDLVGELIRVLTEEITAELNSESSPPY